MVVNEIRPFKRAKRRSTSDLCDFLSFPSVSGDGDGDCFAEQPFWSAVQSFLKQYGHSRFPPSLFPSLVTWQILLRVGDPADGAGVVSLDVVEEDVARSRSVYCDQCRVVGELVVLFGFRESVKKNKIRIMNVRRNFTGLGLFGYVDLFNVCSNSILFSVLPNMTMIELI